MTLPQLREDRSGFSPTWASCVSAENNPNPNVISLGIVQKQLRWCCVQPRGMLADANFKGWCKVGKCGVMLRLGSGTGCCPPVPLRSSSPSWQAKVGGMLLVTTRCMAVLLCWSGLVVLRCAWSGAESYALAFDDVLCPACCQNG